MADINVKQALDKILSDKTKERADGWAYLKHMFTQTKQDTKIDSLSEKAIPALLDGLFRAIEAEKTAFFGNKNSSKARFSQSAAVFRAAVEALVRKFRTKTLRTLSDYITDKGFEPDEIVCEILFLEYYKSLRAILEFQPHVEHLDESTWRLLVDYCNEGIQFYRKSSTEPATVTPTASKSRLVSSSRHDQRQKASHGRSALSNASKVAIEEFVECLRCLISASNAPMLDKAEAVVAAVLGFFQDFDTNSRAHSAAMTIINVVLSKISAHFIPLTQETILEVLPLIRRWWTTTKSASLKAQMMVTLIESQAYLQRMVLKADGAILRSTLEGILEAMQTDYSKRLDREQLQLDEIVLLSLRRPPVRAALQASSLYVRGGNPRTEQIWAVPHLMAALISILDSNPLHHGERGENGNEDCPSKRRRVTMHFYDLVQQMQTSVVTSKLCALHTLFFVLDRQRLAEVEMRKVLDQLMVLMTDESGVVSSWAMVTLACCTRQPAAYRSEWSSDWLHIWHVASRSATVFLTCRAACHLMDTILVRSLVNLNSIADAIDAMISSIDINAPATLTDSALSFWTSLLDIRNTAAPGGSLITSERVLHWLLSKWSPARLTDRSYVAQHSVHAQPISIINLLLTCTGYLRTETQTEPVFSFDMVGQAALRYSQTEKLLRYLLLDDAEKRKAMDHSMETPRVGFDVQFAGSFPQLDTQLLDFCAMEFERANENWTLLYSERSQQITSDMVRTLVSLCVIGAVLVHRINSEAPKQIARLSNSVEALSSALAAFLSRLDCEPNHIDIVLEIISPFLPKIRGISGFHVEATLMKLLDQITSVLQSRRETMEDPSGRYATDYMDVDDEFESQRSRGRAETSAELPRHELSAIAHVSTFRSGVSAHLHLLCEAGRVPYHSRHGSPPDVSFIDYLLSLKQHEFLASRDFLREATSAGAISSRQDAETLLVHLGKQYLEKYEYNRCEVALGLCLDVLTGFTTLWFQDATDDLNNVISSLYKWFISIALEKKILSTNTQKGLANFLLRLLRGQPEYAKRLSLPSGRTSLFKILHIGDISVKFQIAEHMSGVFGLFPIKEHDNIFEEVLASLPSESDWGAGIAIRLFVLAQLAASWYTVLRRGVYHIFETPGLIPDATEHATRCLLFVSRALNLQDPRDLLKLFLPQLLYTWLETQLLHSMPYAIFGYSSLAELLKEVRQEAVGQLVMRGNDDEVNLLAGTLKMRSEDLILESFDKVAAYSIARDISLPPAPSPSKYVGGEVRVRKQLGKEKFLTLMQSNFASILGLFFTCVEEEQHVDRAFMKHPQFTYAAKTLNLIKEYSSSDYTLPPNQQPSFRARYLIDEIEHLCRRTNHDATQIWNPALFAFIVRKLLDSIHPAIGPLHACSVIRRIRVLVCIGGKVALQDYPLEMLLHSLRPFLTNPQCAQDATGLVRYFFDAGKAYLTKVPSFVAGISLSILPSLQTFLDSSQESKTADMQAEATYAKAQEFGKWFGAFLEVYSSPDLSGKSENALRKILRSARFIRANVSAEDGTNESDMLWELLKDEKNERRLLSRPSYKLAFSVLCAGFPRPPSYYNDILGSDALSCDNAVTIWRSCQRSDVGRNYLLWAGHVLGRTYAASGCVPSELLAESNLQSLRSFSRGNSPHSSGSRAAILKILHDLLLSPEQADVSAAELTLQTIVLRLMGTDQAQEYEQILPHSLLVTADWQGIQPPGFSFPLPEKISVRRAASLEVKTPLEPWVRGLCIAMAYAAEDDALIGALTPILAKSVGLAEKIFPFILHIVLLYEFGRRQEIRRDLSEAFKEWFRECDESTVSHVKLILTALLYLRDQPMPRETTKADRERWLELDYQEVAKAATQCRMFRTGLLWVEIQFSEAARGSRRSSAARLPEPTDLLLQIFKNIEEPDSFYGVQQQASLSSIIDRLDYERDGFKSLLLRGAEYDSQLRHITQQSDQNLTGIIRALGHLNLSGLSLSILENQRTQKIAAQEAESMYRSARRLERWDLPTPALQNSEEITIYRAFQCINNTSDLPTITQKLDDEFLQIVTQLLKKNYSGWSMRSSLRTLAVLTEIDEVMASRDPGHLHDVWQRLHSRNDWMQVGRFEDVSQILSSRETLFSTLVRKSQLHDLVRCSARESREIEVKTVLDSSRMSRHHGALQDSLKSAMYLSNLIEPCKSLGIGVEAVARFEAAGVLWDQGELTASIRALQWLRSELDLSQQTMRIGSAELLAKLGHQVSEARLEKPDEIISQYLLPAIEELKGLSEGNEAGRVFHEFASFCDRQLQDAGNLQDFQRVQKLRQRKEAEVHDLDYMLSSAGSEHKANLQSYKLKAKQWFDLDDREYQRLRQSRQEFLRQSLENYLLCLKACDGFDTDILRFCALWLEHSDTDIANIAVSRHLPQVPSRKFAPLMNQLSSKLLDVEEKFQSLLFSLIRRICTEHPYHGMYQIFSTSKSKGKDELAISRHAAALKMAALLNNDSSSSDRWQAIYHTSMSYARLAQEKLEERYNKPGSKVALRKLQAGSRLEQDIPAYRIPPPTMKVEIRADCNYSSIPIITKIQPELAVAGGVSAPKIITAIGSNGLKYKQLIKGGNDDLRQDAIMEQVFEHVSGLLQHDRLTRQRNLVIRTYKVMPLNTHAGIIEFVPDTIPLHDYLLPAHQKHFPKDWRPHICRKHISDVQSKSVDARLKAYRLVVDHFHPVLRYFFIERFVNPDDWFEKRLAYCRSTAAISILGHVLGLGDRHGHNILLDEKTGQVVHIDLGVAFEQGRVLPIPEVVPFRLTRDIVDAMGITRTEGVFRRCCEFTLDALRKESYSIMTVLDVLRYDPLYNWTLSPLRIKRMQEQNNEMPQPSPGDAVAAVSTRSKASNEPSEAERALTVVAKKLSKTLSVTATVNELIQQATDERNLAILYCGWAAYA